MYGKAPVSQFCTSAWDRGSYHRVSVPDLLSTKAEGTPSPAGPPALGNRRHLRACSESQESNPWLRRRAAESWSVWKYTVGSRNFIMKRGSDGVLCLSRGVGVPSSHTRFALKIDISNRHIKPCAV